MKPKCLFVQTYYPEFLDDLYHRTPALRTMPFEAQREALLKTRFGVSDAYSDGLRRLGCACDDIVCNADPLQRQWAKEHDLTLTGNIHDRRRQVLAAQVKAYQPDVLYVFEWSPLGDEFLSSIKPFVGQLVGQLASPLPANRSFAAYDLMISSWPPIVDYFQTRGTAAAYVQLGFDERVLDLLNPAAQQYDVSFVGGFAPSHRHRIAWLESLLCELDVAIFAYGIDTIPQESPIHSHYLGSAWGQTMYDVLAASRITLNCHARIDINHQVNSTFANNMRLYEATGVGTCLVTDAKNNLDELFTVGQEVVTYTETADCLATVDGLLADESRRIAIAKAGQQRTLADHTYRQRMKELLAALQESRQYETHH